MNVNEYQKKALSTAVYPGQGTLEGLKYAALGLAGEVGELANKLKKHLRNGTAIDNEALVDELGDVLWYCAAVARECKTPLSSVAMRNLEKLARRKEKDELKEHSPESDLSKSTREPVVFRSFSFDYRYED